MISPTGMTSTSPIWLGTIIVFNSIEICINISVYVQIHVLVNFFLKEVFFVCGIGTGEGNNS